MKKNELEKEIEQAKLSWNDAGGETPPPSPEHQQPLKLLHFPSPLMADEKLTDAPTHSWWPLQNQDAVFPSRIFAAISSLLVHLVPMLNGSAPNQQAISLSINGQAVVSVPALPTQIVTSPASEPVGTPTECLLLKNMFDTATEIDPDFALDIKDGGHDTTEGVT